LNRNRVLLSSVATPIGEACGDGAAVGYELLHAQVTRAQGVFSPRAVHTQYGLDYIAANLDAPTVTLHYPDEDRFVEELRQGHYTHVGIGFNLSTSHRMRHMARLVREHAPSATLILGGYGAVLPDEELLRHGDVVCRGEGVAFTRELLGEPPRPRPYHHPLAISTMRILSVPVSKTGLVFAGLGCANGCDFCATSHFFHRRHIPLLPGGSDLLRVLTSYRAQEPEIEFTVLDEDFLLDKRRAMAFRDVVQAAGVHLDMFVFASVRALSQYTAQELVEIGVGGVWLGYEGARAGYAKQVGRPLGELVPDLKRHGIMVLASMIVGLDYQTAQAVREEHAALMALEPTLSQFLIYGPTPGTPLAARVEREGRLLPKYAQDQELRWRHSDGFRSMIRHPHMAPEEIEALQTWCFEEDFRQLGPSVIRTGEVWAEAYEYLRHATAPALARRAQYLRKRLLTAASLLPAGRALAPSREAARRIDRLEERVARILGWRERWLVKAAGTAAIPFAGLTALKAKLGLGEHPRTVRYDWAAGEHPTVVRFSQLDAEPILGQLPIALGA
jgi:radical SAM superfamily enzyme YgiQ (UPF0313 family)